MRTCSGLRWRMPRTLSWRSEPAGAARSRPHECQQRSVVSCVRCAQRADIVLPHFTVENKIARTPSEWRRIVLHQQHVGNGPREPAVPVCEWMNPNQSMTEARGDFVEGIAFVPDLYLDVLAKITERRLNICRIDADVLFAVSKVPAQRQVSPNMRLCRRHTKSLLSNSLCLRANAHRSPSRMFASSHSLSWPWVAMCDGINPAASSGSRGVAPAG